MGWGPRFTHNISLFYPQAILHYFGANPTMKSYPRLITLVMTIIEADVLIAAKNLNSIVKQQFRKDIFDIEEYSVLNYWSVLEAALSSPIHIGVKWGPKLVQAKFIDTDALGGLRELQEIQHAVYPRGTGNLGAWVSFYNRWRRGEDDRIGDTLQQRLSMMASQSIAPFAELIETGNDMYPAYPTHSGKHTLETMKPYYNREMRAAFHRVMVKVEPLVRSYMIVERMVESQVVVAGTLVSGFSWVSRKGNIIFVLKKSLTTRNRLPFGSGYVLSPTGDVLKTWHGWLPR